MWPPPARLLLKVASGLACLVASVGAAHDGSQGRQAPFAVVGYVPEYRFNSVEWAGIVSSTTHIVLFSMEPGPEGELMASDLLRDILRPASGLRAALDQAGQNAPKVLIAVGGAGRSKNFPEVAASSKARKKFVKQIARLIEANPFLAGVDLDWEAPQSQQQWKELGIIARELRTKFADKPDFVLSCTYHPRSGAVQAFAGLRGKKSDTAFVDFFNMFHAMAYSQYDRERRHSSPQIDRAALGEWAQAGLPPEKLSLGLPFFGVVRKTGEAKTYEQILAEEPSLASRPGVDESTSGVYFVNARSVTEKVQFAHEHGLAGVMIWELGQDRAVSSGQSLLQPLWAAAKSGKVLEKTWHEELLTRMHAFGENELIGMATATIGAYLLVKVFTFEYPRERFAPKPRQKEQLSQAEKAKADEGEKAKAEGAKAKAEGQQEEEADPADAKAE